MKKFWILFLLIVFKINAQTYMLSGELVDENGKALENATVTLMKAKDSSIINFMGTEKDGSFELKIPLQQQASILQISLDKYLNYTKRLEAIDQDLKLGLIKLKKDNVTEIEEVQITVSPVKIKKDTVEYNASYLKVKPESKIDDLLKEIPGVEVDDDGNICVNGKPINKILINGKPFFDKDGKIALQTFPADIIKKIQITTSKTKEQEFTRRVPPSDSLTVNFNIDEKNNKGNLNNLMLGYGTQKRYEATALLTRFKQQRNIAFIGAANNINTTGFSVNNFFQSGSKNSSVNGRPVNSGLMETVMLGINYSDKIGDRLDLDKFSLQYNDNNLDTYSKTARTTFLPDSKLDKLNERNGRSDNRKFDFNTDASIKIDSLTNITFSANLSNTNIDNHSESETYTSRNDNLLNSSKSVSRSTQDNNIFSPKIGLMRRFRKAGRSLSASIDNTFATNKNISFNNQETIFYESPDQNDYRNQRSQTKNSRNLFGFDFKFYEPLSEFSSLSLELNYDYQDLKNEKSVSDYDAITQQYSLYNPLLSNSLSQNNNFWKTKLAYNLNNDKINFRIGANLNVSKMDIQSVFNSEQYNYAKKFVLPEYEMSLQYKISKTRNLRFSNQARYTLPSAMELNPYINLSNPLVIDQGNPNLKSTWTNSTDINYSNSDVAKGINFYVRAGFQYTNNDIVDYSYYDDSGKQYSSYENISGNKRVNLNLSLTKTYKWNGHQFKVNPSLNSSYNFRKGFIDGTQYLTNIYNLTPRINLTLNWKDVMDVRSSYFYNYSFSKYMNYSLDKTQSSRHNLNIGVTNYFFDKNLFIDNDFRYTANNNISSGFNRDSYFWNASINYQFNKKQMLLRFKVYDLLNQRQNITRTIADNYVEDKEELILKQYFMLTLIMKFDKIGGSKN